MLNYKAQLLNYSTAEHLTTYSVLRGTAINHCLGIYIVIYSYIYFFFLFFYLFFFAAYVLDRVRIFLSSHQKKKKKKKRK